MRLEDITADFLTDFWDHVKLTNPCTKKGSFSIACEMLGISEKDGWHILLPQPSENEEPLDYNIEDEMT